MRETSRIIYKTFFYLYALQNFINLLYMSFVIFYIHFIIFFIKNQISVYKRAMLNLHQNLL